MLWVLLLLPLALGACSFKHVNEDNEARPETIVGVGATTLFPGQRGPAMGAVLAPPGSAPAPTGTQAAGSPPATPPAPGGPAASGAPPAPREDLTVIGQASADASRSVRIRDTPLGPITSILGYPFWIFGQPQGFRGVRRC